MGAQANLTPFPRSVRTYVGRTEERARIRDWLGRETLFLIYGVGGIGKSEFAYRVMEDLRGLPDWGEADTILLRVRRAMRPAHVLARLRVALGVGAGDFRTSGLGLSSRTNELDELAETARVLDARPALVFIDDVHHLEPEQAAHMLGYLSRHVRNSRILAASRVEIPLPPDMPLPGVIRLDPLSAADCATIASQLAEQLGLEQPDPDWIFRRSGGSPFFVQRLLVAGAGHSGAGEVPGDDVLGELAPGAR
ncbi:MAG: AAA family ATPase, partial [Myxococcota bacterium]